VSDQRRGVVISQCPIRVVSLSSHTIFQLINSNSRSDSPLGDAGHSSRHDPQRPAPGIVGSPQSTHASSNGPGLEHGPNEFHQPCHHMLWYGVRPFDGLCLLSTILLPGVVAQGSPPLAESTADMLPLPRPTTDPSTAWLGSCPAPWPNSTPRSGS
jgi:hypothetical protein